MYQYLLCILVARTSAPNVNMNLGHINGHNVHTVLAFPASLGWLATGSSAYQIGELNVKAIYGNSERDPGPFRAGRYRTHAYIRTLLSNRAALLLY
ncbi:hypothetical protein B0H15DRAFT_516392 [Mycena belliarum]|uniref:Uncharacterized protein n=1 Tax=Mycena belliarum TaxID=1033014 RepID=A0AAD6XHH1_9AGAR|nr:hypothetical protein B0H15DRAFT_516392 [Mycena belliae]